MRQEPYKFVRGSQRDHRQVGEFLHGRAELKAAQAGRHDVCDSQVEQATPVDYMQGTLTRGGGARFEASVVERVSDQAQDRLVVIYDEDALESLKKAPRR
jgi:hypothetical protein